MIGAIALTILAIWGPSYTVVYKDGPYGIIRRIKKFLGVKYVEVFHEENVEGVDFVYKSWVQAPQGAQDGGAVPKALTCVYCFSAYMTLFILLLSPAWLTFWFGMWGGAMLIQRILDVSLSTD